MAEPRKIPRNVRSAVRRLTLALGLLFTLSGCWDQDEVNHVGFIISAGVDAVENDEIRLTIQVFIPNPTGGGPGEGGGEGRVFTYTGIGASVPEAMTSLQVRLPRTLSWDHAKLIIVGESLANRGVRDVYDFLFRDIEPREQANFLVCRGFAKDLLQSLDDPNTYDTILRIAEMPAVGTYNMNYVEESMAGESRAFVLPVANTMKLMANREQKTVLTIKGVAVIKDAKLVGWIDEKKSKSLHLGFQWLHQTKIGRNLAITVKHDGGKITARLIRRKLKLEPRIEGGRWKMKVRLKLDADIVQNSSSVDLLSPSDQLRNLQGLFENELRSMLESTLFDVQTSLDADVIGFARAFHKRYPRQWKEAQDRWDGVFREIESTIEVKFTLRKPGISNVKT